MEQIKFKQLVKFFENAEDIKGLDKFKEKRLGELYWGFQFRSDAMAIEVTSYDDNPVLVWACKLETKDGKEDYQFKVLPLTKLEKHVEYGPFEEIHRIILRANNRLELLDEECGFHLMMADLDLSKDGFPTANKTFAEVNLSNWATVEEQALKDKQKEDTKEIRKGCS